MNKSLRSINGANNITPRPGWDWTVFYRWDDEPGIHAMTIFGAMTLEQAIDDARFSLGEAYEILGLARQDLPFEAPAGTDEDANR